MKKIIVLTCALLLSGCSTSTNAEHTTRIVDGVYDTSGIVMTDDGHIWSYTQDDITENASVYALIDDNGTPHYIYDDEVYGVVPNN